MPSWQLTLWIKNLQQFVKIVGIELFTMKTPIRMILRLTRSIVRPQLLSSICFKHRMCLTLCNTGMYTSCGMSACFANSTELGKKDETRKTRPRDGTMVNYVFLIFISFLWLESY